MKINFTLSRVALLFLAAFFVFAVPHVFASVSALPVSGYESSDTEVAPVSPGDEHATTDTDSQDETYWTTALSANGSGYDTQVYKFAPVLAGIANPKFDVSWIGHGAVPDGKNVLLSIWNSLSSVWEDLATNHCATDCTLSGNKTGVNYKDGDGNVWVKAKADNYVPPIAISDVSFNGTNNITWNSSVPGDSEVIYDTTPHATWQEFLDNSSNGTNPYGALISVGGLLYGVTHSGGLHGEGTVFSFNSSNNTVTKIHDFDYNSDGGSPYTGLTNIGGMLYGTTYYGGAHGYGTIFSIDTTNSNQFTDIYDFNGTSDGCYIYSTLANIGGVLYGMASQCGAGNFGTIYSIDTTNGNTFTKLHDLDSSSEGSYPYGSFTNVGGVLYATGYTGGAHSFGTVFSFNPVDNTVVDVHDFNATDGLYPLFSTPVNVNGVLYGYTYYGGTKNQGVAFTIDTTNGNAFNKIHDFDYTSDGAFPLGAMINIDGILMQQIMEKYFQLIQQIVIRFLMSIYLIKMMAGERVLI